MFDNITEMLIVKTSLVMNYCLKTVEAENIISFTARSLNV